MSIGPGHNARSHAAPRPSNRSTKTHVKEETLVSSKYSNEHHHRPGGKHVKEEDEDGEDGGEEDDEDEEGSVVGEGQGEDED